MLGFTVDEVRRLVEEGAASGDSDLGAADIAMDIAAVTDDP